MRLKMPKKHKDCYNEDLFSTNLTKTKRERRNKYLDSLEVDVDGFLLLFEIGFILYV